MGEFWLLYLLCMLPFPVPLTYLHAKERIQTHDAAPCSIVLQNEQQHMPKNEFRHMLSQQPSLLVASMLWLDLVI
jgi:hypothetical protein